MSKIKTRTDLTQARAKELVDYDPETGVFRWRYRADAPKHWNTRYAGTEAGTIDKNGYRQIFMDGARRAAHRVAVLVMTGAFPEEDADHWDLDRSNNAWGNIRVATRSQNKGNVPTRRDCRSGIKGAALTPAGTYAVQIRVRGKVHCLGTVATKQEAAQLYAEAATKHFGQFARTA